MKPAAIENIRIKILAPYIASLIIIFFGGMWSLEYYQEGEQKSYVSYISTEVQHTFHQNIKKNIELIQGLGYFVLKNQQLQSAYIKNDRVKLFDEAGPIFQELYSDYGISHFYFHDLDGKNLLRVHQPARFGDDIHRVTLRNAMQTLRVSSGLEFGTFGQFVLRVVFPWVVEGELIGFVEIGEEIDDILTELSSTHGQDFLLGVDKDFVFNRGLDKTEFFSSREELLKNASGSLIIYKTTDDFPESLSTENGIIASSINTMHEYKGLTYLLTKIPVRDMSDEVVASLYYLVDVTMHIARTRELYQRIVLTFGCVALVLAFFYSGYSRRLNRVIRWNLNRLRKEIKDKEITQKKLEQSNDKLESLIGEKNNSLAETRQQYQLLFNKSADASFIVDEGKIIDCNQAALDMFLFDSKDELISTDPGKISPEYQGDGASSTLKAQDMIATALERGSHSFEWDHMRCNHEIFPAEVVLTSIPLDSRTLIYGVVRDITDRKKAAAKIEHQAYYDQLTGLSNRRLLIDRLKQTLITSRRHHYNGALLYIDIDRFKSANDALGHAIGDELLVEAAKRIKMCISDEDTAARFGGDEYVVLLRHLGKTDKETASLNAEKVASKIQKSFKKPFSVQGQTVHLTTSIGIAMYPFVDETYEDVIQHADAAMSSAKENGRNQIAYYHARMHDKVTKRLSLEKDLRNALKDEELTVVYQPQIGRNGKMIAVEALVRWQHPVHGFVNPEEFIEIAEKTGLIHELGSFVIHRAIQEILSYNLSKKTAVKLAVNISPVQFKRDDFVQEVKNIVSKYQLEKDFLTLELTESVTIANLNEAIEKIDLLRHLGVRLSLDDFGTGYSSLSHLKKLPIDELKIDRSFVFDIEKDPQDALLVKTIIKISHQFKLDVVAEGVETEAQRAFLDDEGCDVYQGYYYSKPIDLDTLLSVKGSFSI